MRTALRGRGTRHDDELHEELPLLLGRRGRPEAPHLTVRTQPRPVG